MIEIIFGAVAILAMCFGCFILGWSHHKFYLKYKDNEELIQEGEIQYDDTDIIKIKIEEHFGINYIYDADTNVFIVQCSPDEDIFTILRNSFPGKSFTTMV